MKILKWVLTLSLVFWTGQLMTGCVSAKRKSQKAATAQRGETRKAEQKAAEVRNKSEQAVKEQKISGSAHERIGTYIESQQDSMRMDEAALEGALTDLQSAGKRGHKSVPDAVRDVDFVIAESARRLRAFEAKTAVILDFLDSDTFSKSEMNTLFPTGEYRLKPAQVRQGVKMFAPTVEKLFQFSEKYKGSFKNLEGEIVITGYSDAMPVETGSRLYTDLASRLGRDDQIREPTTSEINRKLSELRAESVKTIVEDILKDKKNKDDFLNISVRMLGRGEELPPFLTGTVTRDDKRRRIVTFYWVVLPTL